MTREYLMEDGKFWSEAQIRSRIDAIVLLVSKVNTAGEVLQFRLPVESSDVRRQLMAQWLPEVDGGTEVVKQSALARSIVVNLADAAELGEEARR